MAISVVYMSRYYRTEIDAYLHLGISTMISSKPTENQGHAGTRLGVSKVHRCKSDLAEE